MWLKVHSLASHLKLAYYPTNPISQISMSFSKSYGGILSPFLEEYKEAKNEKARKEVLKNAAAAVSTSKAVLENAGDLPKDLQAVRWFIFFINLYWYIWLRQSVDT